MLNFLCKLGLYIAQESQYVKTQSPPLSSKVSVNYNAIMFRVYFTFASADSIAKKRLLLGVALVGVVDGHVDVQR